jgi:hypothetical protein
VIKRNGIHKGKGKFESIYVWALTRRLAFLKEVDYVA